MASSKDTTYWDAFVSHAWEDKQTFVRPLVGALSEFGVSLWYDEISLKPGDSLSGSIERGIAKSRTGIVVVSPAFLGKNWPEAELRALMTRRIETGIKLLPVWHGVGKEEVASLSPMLADLIALVTADRTAQEVALAVLAEIRPDLYEATGRSQLEALARGAAFEDLQNELLNLREKVSELLCPHCEAPLVERILSYDYGDPNQADVDTFECGLVIGGNYPQACRHDPNFPPLSDYELRCESVEVDTWLCSASPKSEAAKRHRLTSETGCSESEARERLIANYNHGAPPAKQVHEDPRRQPVERSGVRGPGDHSSAERRAKEMSSLNYRSTLGSITS